MSNPALETIHAYFSAWTSKDLDTAMTFVADDVVPVKSAPAAECVTVVAGKIVYNRFIFDRVPFQAARAAPS